MGKVTGHWEEDGLQIFVSLLLGWLNYIIVCVALLFCLYLIRILSSKDVEDYTPDSKNLNERLSGRSLNLNKWSCKFEDAVVEIVYQYHVREKILPKVNLFFLCIFSAFSIVKASRLFQEDINPHDNLFEVMPRSRILENLSAMVHCAIFQYIVGCLETDKAWENCCHKPKSCGKRCCPKTNFFRSKTARVFYYRDLIQLTRFLLFAAPYLLQIPAALMCILNGNFLPSAQCQHIYWSSHVKHRIIDNRMNENFKNFLNHKETSAMHTRNTFHRYEEMHKQYKLNESALGTTGPKTFDDYLFSSNSFDSVFPPTATECQQKSELSRRYEILSGVFVESSVRPWVYARDLELMTVYAFALLLGYALVQMATWDAGITSPCSKKPIGFGFFLAINVWAFSWAFFLQLYTPWTTLTEILIRPLLYWICFVYFVYFIEYSRRQAWSRSVEIERHLRDKSKLHALYQEMQDRFVSDLAHNYGNMSSTVVLCWNDALEANEMMMEATEKGDSDSIVKMQQLVKNSVQKAKELVDMTQTVVLASVRNLKGNIVNQPTRVNLAQSLHNIPFFTSQFNRFNVMVDPSVPKYVCIDYSVFLTCTINFASNAQKYSKGKIVLRASYINRKVTISVIDEGEGVPCDKQHKIFTRGPESRLNSSDVSIHGEGIGLHSVATLVYSVGGRFGLISPWKDGSGSNFWFELSDENEGLQQHSKPMASRRKTINDREEKEKIPEMISDDGTKMEEKKTSMYDFDEGVNTFMNSQESSALNVSNLESKHGGNKSDLVTIHVIGEENMPYDFDYSDHDSFRMLIVEDNPLMVLAMKNKFVGHFRDIGVPAKLYIVDSKFPNVMGAISLRLMQSDYIFDLILLDQQLGLRDSSKNAFWGTDIIVQYNDWLKSRDIADSAKWKEQLVHLMSNAGSLNILRSELPGLETNTWLSPSPFSKPLQERDLHNFVLSNYPRYARNLKRSDPSQ